MSDNNNGFAERLQRIQEKQGSPQPEDQPIATSGGGNRLIVLSVFAIGMIMVLAAGALIFSRTDAYANLKSQVSTQFAALTDFRFPQMNLGSGIILEAAYNSAEREIQEQQAEIEAMRDRILIAPAQASPSPPMEPATTDRMGTIFGAGHAATHTATPVALNTVFTGFKPTGPNSQHGVVTPFDANNNCTLRPVGTDEKLINVNIGRAHNDAPIQLISEFGIQETISAATKEALEDGRSIGMMTIPRGKMGVIDVIVTDTSGPLYLALQSQGRNLWNIHAAPGVDIAHIALISNTTSALTGSIGDASFEAIRASDFGNQIQFYNFDGEPGDLDCMARPFRKPDETWGAWAGAKGGNTLDGNLLFGQDKGFDSYNHWFLETLGVSATHNLISAAQAGAVMVGDIPSAYLSAATAIKPVYITYQDRVLTGSEQARESELVGIYTDLITSAAGGDYRDVRPPAETVSEPVSSEPTASEVTGGRRNFGELVMNTNDIASKVSLTELNKARRVSFSTRMKLEDFLEDGEALPPTELRLTYAMMRAPRAMMRYCADTLAEIASACEIFRTTVHDAGDDEYQIRADFAYVPNYSIGDVERIRGGDFVSAFLPDTDENATYQTAEERRAFLARMKDACATIRTEYGNCLIGTAGFYLDRPSRFAGTDVSARAAGWVEVYLPDNRFEQRNFQENVTAIFAEQ